MFKKSKVILLATVMMIIAAVIFAGCSSSSKKPLPSQPTNPSPGTTGTAPGTGSAPGNGTGGQSLGTIQAPGTGSGMDMAKTITSQLTATAGVKRAAVVVDGNVAIVGVQFTDGSGKATTTALQGSSAKGTMPGTNVAPAPGNAGITTSRTTGLPGNNTQVNPMNPASPNTTTQNNAVNRNSGANRTGTTNGIGGMNGTNGISGTGNKNTTNKGQTGGAATTAADIKTLIANKVKAASPNISKVLVTTDVSMVDRLSTVSNVLNRDLKDVTNRIQTGGGAR